MNAKALSCLMCSLLASGALAETPDGRAAGTVPAVVAMPEVPPLSTPLPGGSDRDDELRDQVIADDLIIQGSGCFGFDCVNNESFGADTIRLKENNLRIKFDDTSATGGFPSNDWQLTANDQASGGANKFSIEDITGAKVPFTVMAGAPTNSIFVNATGQVGFKTATPVLDVHVTNGNTPGARLEQNGSSGFTPQTWDVAGNEANFFIRDVTGGSRLPFRILPGSPSSSIFVRNEGVAILGTTASAKLHVHDDTAAGTPVPSFRVTNGNYTGDGNVRFEVDSDGNVTARGAITQLSSRLSKENLTAVDGRSVLERLAGMPIQTWNYIGQQVTEQHLGPVAEDFHAAFGLGDDASKIALSDMAGVALAAVKELHAELQQRDRQIAEQEQRLRALEARLAKLGQE